MLPFLDQKEHLIYPYPTMTVFVTTFLRYPKSSGCSHFPALHQHRFAQTFASPHQPRILLYLRLCSQEADEKLEETTLPFWSQTVLSKSIDKCTLMGCSIGKITIVIIGKCECIVAA